MNIRILASILQLTWPPRLQRSCCLHPGWCLRAAAAAIITAATSAAAAAPTPAARLFRIHRPASFRSHIQGHLEHGPHAHASNADGTNCCSPQQKRGWLSGKTTSALAGQAAIISLTTCTPSKHAKARAGQPAEVITAGAQGSHGSEYIWRWGRGLLRVHACTWAPCTWCVSTTIGAGGYACKIGSEDACKLGTALTAAAPAGASGPVAPLLTGRSTWYRRWRWRRLGGGHFSLAGRPWPPPGQHSRECTSLHCADVLSAGPRRVLCCRTHGGAHLSLGS